jgi:threonine synthase
MRYISTRGQSSPCSFSQAALKGLAEDGGLYVPEFIPQLDLEKLRGQPYWAVACSVMAPFCDLPRPTLEKLCQEAYPEKWGVAPYVSDPWGGRLELFHGPTYSFKDVALQFLSRLLEHLLQQRSERLNLLVATSGDTGSAALASVVGCAHLKAIVMYPRGRVSPLQELQMTTLLEPNTLCLEVEGTFDDCQAILKELNRDLEWKARYRLGAVNSVNWARLLAQSCYYVYSYLQAGQPLHWVVPTGNFGNVLSAWLATEMGVPFKGITAATNSNDIVHRFLSTGQYQRAEVSATLAPAMDIQVASNLERYLYFLTGAERTRACMKEFEETGHVSPFQTPPPGPIGSGRADREEILRAVRHYHRHTGQVLCPHSAVAHHVATQLGLSQRLIVCTAHSGKFPEATESALGPGLGQHQGLLQLHGQRRRSFPLAATATAVRTWFETEIGTQD